MDDTFTPSTKLFYIDDYPIMRDSMRLAMANEPSVDFVGDSDNVQDLMKTLEKTNVEVILLDLYLDQAASQGTCSGFDICQLIHELYPHIHMIILSAYDDAQSVSQTLRLGAKGFVSKKSGFNELMRAIKSVLEGNIFICTHTSKRIHNMTDFLLGIDHYLRSKDDVFSQRERQVLNLLAIGHSSRDIGTILEINERTVDSHRKNMMDKASVKNIAELISYAFFNRLIIK